MDDVGRHEAPVNGTVITNGAAPVLMPLTIHPSLTVRQRGMVAAWPQNGDNDAVADAKPDALERVMGVLRVIFARRAWLAAVPVILVNAVAFGAQLGFWRAHVPTTGQAAVIALALETVAIYLAWHAHLAQLADDAALRLRLAAYGFAAGIGALNYSHWDGPGWRPTVEAVTFGLMSAISPWLWSVYSRRVSRDALKAKGLIEPHAVRLGGTRWAWHPVRSIRVMSNATWAGETDPAAAIATWQPRKSGAQVTVTAVPQVAPEPPIQVNADPAPGQPQVTPWPASQVKPRRKTQVKPAAISDADLKEELRPVLAANTSVSINAAAKAVGRGRDRIRPLLEELRKELNGAKS